MLACAEGAQNKAVAARLQIDRATVGKWRRRFVEHRLDGLRDEPRAGAPRTIEDARIEAVVVRTLESVPPDATHWSSCGMSRACGLSVSTVQRIWRAFGLGTSALFSWYAANFGSFNKTYGSLGAAIGFMTWIWLSVIIVLLGGKLNAETEHQTARDSTVGPPKPLGARHAKMADTVGYPPQ